MDTLKHLNAALGFIEEHITDEIDMGEVARMALCSEYHFRRMFPYLAGVSLSEYIRRRRLTLAAFELQEKDAKVIDVALKYGYSSPDSFSRAFQNVHGISPSQARCKGRALKAFPPLQFYLSIRGGSELQYRIVEKKRFKIVGIGKRVKIMFAGVNPEIAQMWESLDMDMIRELKELSDQEPSGLIQASVNFDEGRMEEKGGLDHYIGVATVRECPAYFTELEVEASSWAVFTNVGPFPETLQTTWGRIYSEWLPTAHYEVVPGPEILWTEMRDTNAPDFKSEIWIPVKKKSA